MKKEVVIQLKKVIKKYTLHHQKPTLSEQIFIRSKKEKFTALKNVSLRIYKGDKVGIIGKNGSGKTTLLKIIAGITTPNSGEVKTQGRIVSLIDLEAGFHSDLTGEENIYLNGVLVGMTRKEIKEKFAEIVTFADIGQFIDAPLYTYSQGMKLRLGFSIAVHAQPDILIQDENFATGDQWFQEKARKRIHKIVKSGTTLVIVTHWLEFLEKNCQKFFWLENGELVTNHQDKKVLSLYRKKLHNM
jgi:ABC-type polysaccharide/polyol phosphate transport system ATPase subunit